MLTTGPLLHNLKAEAQNLVFYFINPFTHATSIVDLCAIFVALCSAYTQVPTNDQVRNSAHRIILQLIPLRFVVSNAALPDLKPTQLFTLAMSVYDRCSLVRGDETQPALAPSVLLTPKIPTHIPFKLSAEPAPSLLSGNNCLHVAYSWGIDDRWMSVAWSDQLGGRQISASFCFARTESEPRRPFRDVADEVWVRSLGLMQDQKAPWRLMIAKAGAMESEEVEGPSHNIWVERSSFEDVYTLAER